MDYPLGSFPRFAHQDDWAAERRARGRAKSALRRRCDASYHLMVEIGCYNFLARVANGIKPLNQEGVRSMKQINGKLSRIYASLKAGKRVYYKRLGRLIYFIAVVANVWPQVRTMTEDQLAMLAEMTGRDNDE